MFCPVTNAFHVVPLSVLRNVNISLLFRVEVIVGAVLPADHLKPAGQATVLAVPSAVRIKTKLMALLAVEGTFDKVRVVMLAFSDTSKIMLFARLRVNVAAEMVGADSFST
jgi:hypothetical protein